MLIRLNRKQGKGRLRLLFVRVVLLIESGLGRDMGTAMSAREKGEDCNVLQKIGGRLGDRKSSERLRGVGVAEIDLDAGHEGMVGIVNAMIRK